MPPRAAYGEDREPVARFRPGSKCVCAFAVLAFTLVLGAALVVDVVTLPDHWELPRPFRAAGFSEVAGAQGRARTLNVIIAIAARDLADGEIEVLAVPENRDDLVDVKPDSFADVPQQTIDPRLIDPFVAGAATVVDYDPRVDSVDIQRWKKDNRLVEYPRNVYGVRADGPATRFAVYADQSGSAVYVVPEGLVATTSGGVAP